MFVRAYFSLQLASHLGLLPLPELLMEIKKPWQTWKTWCLGTPRSGTTKGETWEWEQGPVSPGQSCWLANRWVAWVFGKAEHEGVKIMDMEADRLGFKFYHFEPRDSNPQTVFFVLSIWMSTNTFTSVKFKNICASKLVSPWSLLIFMASFLICRGNHDCSLFIVLSGAF